MVRDVEAQVLRLQGYTVLEAQGAAEALRLAREAAAIHLLITDFSMPEVDGLEPDSQYHPSPRQLKESLETTEYLNWPGPLSQLLRLRSGPFSPPF